MLNSDFFRLLLHQICVNRLNMAKKRNDKRVKNSSGRSGFLGIKHIFQDERLSFTLGILLVIVAIYLTLAFVSYFTTGAADQSLIEDPREGEMLNQNHEFANTCGSIGAYASWYFIKRCFGLPAFLIPLFILLLGIHLIRAYRVNLLKWFLALMILMVWASVTLAKFLSPFLTDTCYNPGGDHGLFVCQYIENLVGAPGLTAVLGLTAIIFLTYVSAETILFIRKLLNPTKFLNKVKFKITNNDPNETPDSYINQIEPDDDPEYFDDPATQTVEFKDDGETIVTDKGYKDEDVPVEKPKKTPKAPTDDEVGMEIEVAGSEEKADVKTLADMSDLEPYDPKRDLENYRYPTLDLLNMKTTVSLISTWRSRQPTRTVLSRCCALSAWRYRASKPL